jgi:hypothetical protein
VTIPLATTTITVKRPAAAEPYEAGALDTVAAGVRAHISGPGGIQRQAGGSQEDITLPFACDVADVQHTDQVVDDTTDITYEVVWVERRQGLGLDRMTGQLRRITGAT